MFQIKFSTPCYTRQELKAHLPSFPILETPARHTMAQNVKKRKKRMFFTTALHYINLILKAKKDVFTLYFACKEEIVHDYFNEIVNEF